MKVQPWAAATAAFAAGTIAAVGIAQATSAPTKIPDSSTGVITACFVKKTGAVRFINAQAGKTCKTGEKQVTFNQKGPQGPTGATGATGQTGPSHTYVKDTNPFIATVVTTAGTSVATLTLPAGSYLLHAQTSLLKSDAAMTSLSCELQTSAGSLAADPVFWNPKPDGVGATGGSAPIGLTGTLTEAVENTTVTFFCKATGANGLALDGAVMTATKVGEVTVQ